MSQWCVEKQIKRNMKVKYHNKKYENKTDPFWMFVFQEFTPTMQNVLETLLFKNVQKSFYSH